MTIWLLLCGAIFVEVAASLSLKGSETEPLLYIVVVVGYCSAFLLLSMVLRRGMPLGVAYGVWGASGVALTAILSALLFGESLTLLMGAGILLIIGGVVLIESGSHTKVAVVEGENRPENTVRSAGEGKTC
nr:multidrug efflux SMR transporter [Rhodococcus sp. (in: high G+C Gram-positive bacteria)]